ncbi:hypothetical protein SteCoe_12636 [Stentor coeruleus]|uniref:Uncharacterized protein n=1 Tax=Stentor coeruleus TaxID=5963 RepID=A0A1R2CAA1_9CILI|nr:hypothetical protein SteCoe_12636 [Stentor coeruleus]
MDFPRNNKIRKATYSQESYSLIDTFIFKAEPLLDFRCYELRNLFHQTIDELFLSEIEIIAWLIYIEEIGIKVSNCNIKEFLIFVGLHTKIRLGIDVKNFLENFKGKNPGIIEKFEAWSTLNEQSSQISTIKLGKKYRELRTLKGTSRINYNFYLNDIFRSCTMYQKQKIDDIFDLTLETKKSCSKKQIFEIRKKPKIVENQDYNLKEFDRIDI